MDTIKRKTLNEIQTQIDKLTESVSRKKSQIEEYRKKRAHLVLNEADNEKSKQAITSIDFEIRKLQRDIDNAPAELELLQSQLADEQERIAQEEQNKLIEQQQEVADEIEVLSKQFVSLLEKANGCNIQLKSALTAEAAIRNKTGVNVLTEFCHGSMQSLSMLLETMKSQLDGVHTNPTGSGIVANASPIQL